ncbi:hypothetical protein PIIN_11348 [Serendipita indica DSM 11827]|uniref:Uncharacterized protein n=2 Tax=Serendipita indica (strain DSM 11827) TaxID=1109443 RepID=G4U1C8_SERID|nr:hypothetical protein PIIN_11348 [Serendipita indica DSM 11827]
MQARGELDPHGADGAGNPHGGLVFSNVWTSGTNGLGQQIHEWTNFMSVRGDYEDGFTECKGDSGIPMGHYPQPDGSTSTFHQGQPVTPPAHPAPSTSSCKTFESASLYAATAFSSPTTTSISVQGQATSSMPRPTSNAAGSVRLSSFGAMPCLVASTLLTVAAAASILV